jgi:hypothetical protein
MVKGLTRIPNGYRKDIMFQRCMRLGAKSIKKTSFYQRSSSKERETIEPAETELDNSDLIDLNGGEFLEGMSSATARIVIEKNLP